MAVSGLTALVDRSATAGKVAPGNYMLKANEADAVVYVGNHATACVPIVLPLAGDLLFVKAERFLYIDCNGGAADAFALPADLVLSRGGIGDLGGGSVHYKPPTVLPAS
jgi:hypothetical protein